MTSNPATSDAAAAAAKPSRPLPAGITLPAVKKQRTDVDSLRRISSSSATDGSESDAEAAATIDPAVAKSHNTPSPSFFAAGVTTPRIVDSRISMNPSSPLPPYLTRIRHARQLVVITTNPAHNHRPFKRGTEMDQIEVIEDGGMIIAHDGTIVAVGKDADIAAQYDNAAPSTAAATGTVTATATTTASTLPVPAAAPSSSSSSHYSYLYELDASGCCILPGLVDGHTHPVWAGDRVGEFAMKLAGATYMDIHNAGGGIHSTVTATRAASEEQLLSLLLLRLDRALSLGTTLLEAKSGYGLDLQTEMKMLRVIESASRRHRVALVGNYCGAHTVPRGSTAAAATKDIIDNQLPAIVAAKANGELNTLKLIDVFCETGVFEASDSEAILSAGKNAGLSINFHGDELSPIKAAELGAKLNATAVSHLEHISDAGISAMAAAGVVGTLLPNTAYVLRIKPPPAKKMIEAGVPIALGSDFCPNAHCLSMPFTMNLACIYMGMTLPQALNAATINAAGSLGSATTHGSLAAGKQGDFILLEAERWEHLIYQLVDPPITQAWTKGKLAWRKRDGV